MAPRTTTTTGTALPATEYSDPGEATVHSKGLARKLTCSVVSVVFTGVMLIFFLQLGLVLRAVPDWGSGTKDNMIELEQQNLKKISSDKAGYVTEIFGRLKEGILQAQSFAEQILLDDPETMVVDNYLQSYSGLDQEGTTWEHSVWFITALGEGEYPSSGSSLEGLLNRSSLMDVTFRGMQLQHTLIYLASLNDPSAPEGTVSDINQQPYAGTNTDSYLNQTSQAGCDGYDEYGGNYQPEAYDPRCRPWYQDAIAGDNTDAIFTNPYSDSGTRLLTITVAAPVYNRSEPTVLLGVTGIDMDISGIKNSILGLTIVGDDQSKDENGYAYLLSPGSQGEVAIHRDVDYLEDDQLITDIEKGINENEFDGIVSKIGSECNGSANYSRYEEGWLLAWGHETESYLGAVGNENCGGFAVVVTVKESILLKEFSKMEKEVDDIVAMASVIMAVLLLVICFCTAAFAVAVSNGIVRPVNQLIDVVHSLYTMDFSKHQVGPWMVNDVSSPEVEELIEAFKAMSTVVKAANLNLKSGNLNVARENYVNALILFKKLEDDRGVAIANNNLGTVHTLQAQGHESKAVEVGSQDPVEASRLRDEANSLYADAITNYKQAIDDAKMLCAAVVKNEDDSTLLHDSHVTNQLPEGETKTGLKIVGVTYDGGDHSAADALFLQLSNRKFNLAVCYASIGNSVAPRGTVRNTEAIGQARDLFHECIKLASKSKNDKGDACRVKYLLELASLESRMQRQREAGEALDAAEHILACYRGDGSEGYAPWTGHREGTPQFSLVVGLPQRFLAARGAHCMTCGDAGMAITSWTRAIIGSGDKMDVTAVESSLKGLRDLAWRGHDGSLPPSELLVALGLPIGGRRDTESLLSAIDEALAKVEKASDMMVKNRKGVNSEKTSVDLCFIMDCTGSMQSWIDQAKTKLLEIIEQAKADVGDLNLRVGFVGYRDYGDRPQYEGPYDFHTEQQLPDLIAKLKRIKAFGGTDFPEDMAGGLKLASEGLSWKSNVRLCILIADAPCHGNMYHSGLGDRFPGGDKHGLDPSKMLYNLKYEHGVDLYFIKITDFTDKMMRVFQTRLANLYAENKSRTKTARPRTDHEIKVHDLGSDDNRFLEAVVESVKSSVHMSHLLIEEFVTTLGEGEYPSSGSSLEGLLNRSSLMDVAFRGMQLQHTLMYLASLDDPSAPEGTVSDINMQPYAGSNTDFYLDRTDLLGCDGYDEYGADYRPAAFDPRCRPWYQDAIAGDNTDAIFTNPYSDAETYLLTITVAAPVYNRSDPTVLLGVSGIDMDIADIENSILGLTIIGDDPSKDENGYAYLLSPGSEGEVAVHRYIDDHEDDQSITDIEEGIDVVEFDGIVSKISSECNGSANFTRDGERWLLAWGHEIASVPGAVGNKNCDGFTVVVTVKESALLQEFSQMEEDVGKIVAMASVIMAALLVVICFCTTAFAVTVSNGIVRPVNQLIDVVHSLYTMDFSKHQVGPWMINDVSSPEVEELIEAFKAMSTVVKAANMNLRSGNLSVARDNYVNALILFKKLEDDRGVAIANNNLGTAHTLQAQERESKAVEVGNHDPVEASRLSDEAKSLYADAITNYKQAIDDAKMLCAAVVKNEDDSTLLHDSLAANQPPEDETKTGLRSAGATYDDHDRNAAAALFLQLSNRKFNLAVCHASRGDSVVPRGPVRNTEVIGQARDLLHECIKLASQSKNDKGDACRVKYLLELASLESRMQRQREAGEALNAAEQILAFYRGDGSEGYAPWTGHREETPKFSLVVGLPQRFLAARGAHYMACGDAGMAIASWTRAIIGSGDKMDVAAVESSLKGLRDLAWSGHDQSLLPSELLAALGLPTGGRGDTELLLSAINEALAKVEKARDRMVKNRKGVNSEKTSVDLCFIMDCTGSMQSWIDQAKTKLLEIIEQAKADVGDLNLRVGFVGYRDYGDKPQYEGPYDFHTEKQLPDLVAKLKRIKAFGGTDFPEDMAGGLKLASEGLSWKSHVRLCILIADAPCHGNMYHSGLGDRFPGGDKNGLDPSKMLYNLKYEHGVDLYFIKITDFTDKMMRVFQTRLANLYAENKGRTKTARQRRGHEIKVHDLGSDDNRFLEAVVESVKSSVHMSHLLIEE